MKKDIHPEVHYSCAVTCTCGATHVIASTLPEMKVEICSKCHPFYTGQQKIIDTQGRVRAFEEKMKKAQAHKATASKKEATEEETTEETSVSAE